MLFKEGPQEPVNILCGDAREMLRALPANSVQTVCTSFPYLWKRDYDLPPTIWGETRDCCHEWVNSRYGGSLCNCGAFLGQFGNEPTPRLFVDHCLEVSREIWRVLRDDGVFWLNLDSSYANDTKWGGRSGGKNKSARLGGYSGQRLKRQTGYGRKSLIPIPWLVGIALQEDGWTLRAPCIWNKTNPVPSPQQDRPSMSHEYILMLTKRPHYYYDFIAVQQPVSRSSVSRYRYRFSDKYAKGTDVDGYRGKFGGKNGFGGKTRQLRSVWTFPTQATKGTHYASFPTTLPSICIKASTPEVGCCPYCGAPWRRMIRKGAGEKRVPSVWDRGPERHGDPLVGRYSGKYDRQADPKHKPDDGRLVRLNNNTDAANCLGYQTTGWQMTCHCQYARPVPSVVLDPFCGSGTVGLVAKELGRRAILFDLKAEYCEMAHDRIYRGET